MLRTGSSGLLNLRCSDGYFRAVLLFAVKLFGYFSLVVLYDAVGIQWDGNNYSLNPSPHRFKIIHISLITKNYSKMQSVDYEYLMNRSIEIAFGVRMFRNKFHSNKRLVDLPLIEHMSLKDP